MATGLIGHTGFVGGMLAKAGSYDAVYNSRTINEVRGRTFDRIVCAGVSAVKWQANADPDADRAGIDRLLGALAEVRCARFVLISTIDVYPDPIGVDETIIPASGGGAYGINRLFVETRVRALFPDALIVRLPALFGAGLKKNILYDLLHGNQIEKINPASRFQWYDLSRLVHDLDVAERAGLRLLNLATEPLPTSDIVDRFFPGAAVGGSAAPVGSYDMQTVHAATMGGVGPYVRSRAQVLADMAGFLALERAA